MHANGTNKPFIQCKFDRHSNCRNAKELLRVGLHSSFSQTDNIDIRGLLREKNPMTKCYPSGNKTQAASDYKSNTILSTLT